MSRMEQGAALKQRESCLSKGSSHHENYRTPGLVERCCRADAQYLIQKGRREICIMPTP